MTKAERLKMLREEKGLTQYRLAKLSGIKQAYISKYESGVTDVGFKTLPKLCLALGVSISDFLMSDEEKAALENYTADETIYRANEELKRLKVLRPDGTWDEARLTALKNIVDAYGEAIVGKKPN